MPAALFCLPLILFLIVAVFVAPPVRAEVSLTSDREHSRSKSRKKGSAVSSVLYRSVTAMNERSGFSLSDRTDFLSEAALGNDGRKQLRLFSRNPKGAHLMLRHLSMDSFALPEHAGVRNPVDWQAREQAVMGRYRWAVSPDIDLDLTLGYEAERKDLPGGKSSRRSGGSDRPVFERIPEAEQFDLQLNLVRNRGHHRQTFSLYSAFWDRTLQRFKDPQLSEPLSEKKEDSKTYGLQGQWDLISGPQKIMLGVLHEYQSYQSSYPLTASGRYQADQARLNVSQVYVGGRWGRSDGIRLAAQGAVNYNDLNQQTDSSWLMKADYAVAEGVYLGVNIARSIELPSLIRVFDDTKDNKNQGWVGMPSAVNQHSDKAGRFQFLLFQNEMKRYSDKASEPLYQLAKEHRYTGVSMKWDSPELDRFTFKGEYRFIRPSGADSEDYEQPEHHFRGRAVLRSTSETHLALTGERGLYSDKAPQAFNDYQRFDLTFVQTLPWQGLSWGVGVFNLTDQKYYQKANQLAAGRHWVAGLRAEF